MTKERGRRAIATPCLQYGRSWLSLSPRCITVLYRIEHETSEGGALPVFTKGYYCKAPPSTEDPPPPSVACANKDGPSKNTPCAYVLYTRCAGTYTSLLYLSPCRQPEKNFVLHPLPRKRRLSLSCLRAIILTKEWEGFFFSPSYYRSVLNGACVRGRNEKRNLASKENRS